MDTLEFCRVVHALDRSELQIFDISPATEDGLLFDTMVDKLFQICEQDPTYHVATVLGCGIHINRYLPGGLFYYLCAGEKNPEIIANWSHSWEHHVWLKLRWFDNDII